MTEILGYGEDSMTLALLQNESGLKKVLGISEKIQQIWYRPSFGRGKWFGEFDAIVFTAEKVFLVESKRDGAEGCPQNGKFWLRREQWLRHAIIMFLVERWVEDGPWDQFGDDLARTFKDEFKKYKKELPRGMDSDLEKNLIRFLREGYPKEQKKKEIENTLLFFGKLKKDPEWHERMKNESGFDKLKFKIKIDDSASLDKNGFVVLKERNR